MPEKKYKFLFDFEDNEGIFYEYETDIEPPRIGEFCHLVAISNEKYEDVYLVKEIYYTPQTVDRVDIYITLGKK